MKGIIIDENGDFTLSAGMLMVDDVAEQIVEVVMVSSPGEVKEMPTIGMNINNMINGNVDPFFVGNLKTQLKTQHINAKSIEVSTTEINVEL